MAGMTHLIALVAVLVAAGSVSAQTAATSTEPAPAKEAAKPARSVAKLSDAEILIWTQQIIVEDQNRLRALKSHSGQLARAFESASSLFNRLDAELKGARKEEPGSVDLASVEEKWARSRDQVELLLQRRQAMDKQIEVLQRKIDKQKEALEFITLGQASSSLGGTAAPAVSSSKSNDPKPPPAPAGVPRSFDSPPWSAGEARPEKPDAPRFYDRHVADATRELNRCEAELRIAERRAQLLDQVISLNMDDLAQARMAAEASRSYRGLLANQLAKLAAENEELKTKDAAAGAQPGFEQRVSEARRAAADAVASAEDDAAQVTTLESRIKDLKAVQAPIAERVASAERRLDSARRRLVFLQSPLAPQRIARWFLDAAPHIGLIVMIVSLLWFGAHWVTRRVARGMVKFSRCGSEQERLERVETLRRALQNAMRIAVVSVGTLALLTEFGVDVTVLLGSAAVLSLAIAFGAQSLVKDYFSGFMILMENQYNVGNVVRINNLAGRVEDISLRMTTLRNSEGIAHFVPHGQITSVSNLTHGWSQVVLEVGVAYKENVDHVMEVLLRLARDMRSDAEFGPLIMEEPEMLGVDAFTDSAVIIKLLVRTLPLSQWKVKRELLRRIKNRFDDLGIEIPYPHRTVYHRGLEGPPSAVASNPAEEPTEQNDKDACSEGESDARPTKLQTLDPDVSLGDDR
jgi:small conductance mechanosensitive channel